MLVRSMKRLKRFQILCNDGILEIYYGLAMVSINNITLTIDSSVESGLGESAHGGIFV